MSEVSNLHRFQDQFTISGVETFDFESFSPTNASFFRDEAFRFNFVQQSDYIGFESVHSDPNFFLHGHGDDDDEEEEQLDFITDLFDYRRSALTDSPENSDFLFGADEDEGDELGLGLESEFGGLRIVDMDSESDSEAVDVGSDPNCDFCRSDFWDCLKVNSNRNRLSDEFDWEEVNERENLSSLIGRIEEISNSSHLHIGSEVEEEVEEEEDEESARLEWVFLLAVRDLDTDIGFENNGEIEFEEFIDIDSGRKGSPPAAKSVVENLPRIVLTTEDLKMDKVVCAVCKDDVSVGEEITRLPCSHHYHGDCIVPWLSIRNTCPVCRYELLTDDSDYEKTKDGTGFGLVNDDLQVRYNYQLLL